MKRQLASAPRGGDDHHLGHRQRLRARFMKAGLEGLADYELLELILFRAIPRRDVKGLAKTLLGRFGDIGSVIAAEPARLREVEGLGEAAVVELKLMEAAAQKLVLARVLNRPVLSSWNAVMAHCKAMMGRSRVECFRVLFLDKKSALIADEKQQQGTIDHVPVYPREVIRRGLEINASAIILVHNHPSGDATPSRADMEMTRQIVEAGRAVGIKVHDHIVIGAQNDVSFRSLGLL